ncbi:MAG: sodium-dependent transporter [Oscillospiraceae bacterium]|nr:sodium-dependent transporter [Oscillospiraceae bacterium]MDY6207883.1 sodium-dependent transporter [Oscillospiraceae bacterium]
MENKKSFTSRIGFILAAAGSAVGLGNLWRFPYLAAKYGGGMFLLIYLLIAVTFGFALMITEIAIGRKTGKSALGAFTEMNKKWGFAGVLASLVPCIIFPYYIVIGGWVVKYLIAFCSGQGKAAAGDTYFTEFISQTAEPVIWLSVFLILTAVVVMLGVQKGVEKASRILMPVLVVLSVIIAVYSVTRDGAMDGVIYYLKPDFSKFSISLVFAALGQLFYSMSLAMGIMITYGSYMDKDSNLESSVRQIELFDTGIAFISGLIIIPAVFAFSGGDESVLSSGPSLMFITLPKVFDSMPFGSVMGAVFFILVLFAALTSAISLMETIVSFIEEKTSLKRPVICLIVVIASMILAVPSSLGFGLLESVQILGLSILDFFDFISNNVLMPIVAFLTCIFVSYVVKVDTVTSEVEISSSFKSKKLYTVVIKYIAPVFILIIFVSSVLKGLGIIDF